MIIVNKNVCMANKQVQYYQTNAINHYYLIEQNDQNNQNDTNSQGDQNGKSDEIMCSN